MTDPEPDAESDAESDAPSDAEPRVLRAALILWSLAMGALVLIKIGPLTFVDPDAWHQMSLARELFATGSLPTVDVFAYTPTLRPVVHHEWGAGVLWLAVASAGGRGGFLFFKYLLVAGVLVASVSVARRRGADTVTLLACALPAILLAHYGFTTIRAQLLTMLLLALLLDVLSIDPATRRSWLIGWLALHVLWLNVHAGFVVGLAFLGLAAVERAVRREPFLDLALVTVAAAALVLLNPWGVDYYVYLARGLGMDRPEVPEWAPLWSDPARRWADIAAWAAMVGLAGYALRARGWRACPGVAWVAVTAAYAVLHQRHVTLFAITWFAVAVPWLAKTPLADGARRIVRERARLVVVLAALGLAVWLGGALLLRPWSLRLPTEPLARAEGWPTYPIGAADYLDEQGFDGNLMTPFVEGGYMMWRLHPNGGRISYDGRYEVAYPPSVTAHHRALYGGEAGWRATLSAYPTDLVLVPRPSAALSLLLTAPGWHVVYGDDLYVLVARPDLELPLVDRRGRVFSSTFP
ncbi:MAG: hypothetical protein H6719_26260 [Sandaracinaceae bacterium]|nr:hypothetical protein [Sandaracinaceae bacterium]